MLWIETKTIDDAKQVYERTWGIVSHKTASGVEFNVRGENLFEDGVFWADAIKKIRNDPYDRLALAKRNLPLPAAFRETAISLRAIIRHQRKQMLDYGNPLKMLYRWAAIWSFYIPYAPRIKRRGYDVMARIPFSEFESCR